MKNTHKGFSHILIIPMVLAIGILGYFLLIKTNNSNLLVKNSGENARPENINVSDIEIDESKTVYYDQVDNVYKFIEDHDTFFVEKSDNSNNTYYYFPTKELGIYQRDGSTYETVTKTNHEQLSSWISPNKDYVLVADEIQDPNSEINYKLVQSMKIINIATREEIIVPFPNNLMFGGVLWKLSEDKVYITARKPEGLDYSFKWYYEFNLKSKDFRLIATSDDFVLEYGDSEKNFGHFILGLSGFDSSGKNIIGIGQAPEDPHLLTVWRINPDSRTFTKLFDYNTDTELNWPITTERNFENDKLTIRSEGSLYSMDLQNGKIMNLNQKYEDNYKLNVEDSNYEEVDYNSQYSYIALKNKKSGEVINYHFLADRKLFEYRIITTLD